MAARPLALFLAVGLLGLAADAGFFSWLHGAGVPRAAARAVSLACATGVTWRLNRLFTFAASGRAARAELGFYALVALGAQGVSYAAFLIICEAAPRLPAIAALVLGAALAAVVSFTGQHRLTFRAPLPAQP